MSPPIKPPSESASASIHSGCRRASNRRTILFWKPAAMPMKNLAIGAAARPARSSTGVELMPGTGSRFDQFLKKFPNTKLGMFVTRRLLIPFWASRTPVEKLPGGPPFSIQPGDNLQRMMNLVMPLKNKSAAGRAMAALAIAQNKDEIYAGLDNLGTVHFARFVIVDNNICMMSVYDGDFTNYIRDFIATIGSVFDAVVSLVEGGEAVIPSERNFEKLIAGVHPHKMHQVPDLATGILRDQEAVNGDTGSGNDDLRELPRDLILQLRVNPNVSLGSGYRAYPGYSVAQVRRQFGIGWWAPPSTPPMCRATSCVATASPECDTSLLRSPIASPRAAGSRPPYPAAIMFRR